MRREALEHGDPDAHLHRQQRGATEAAGNGRHRLRPSGHRDGDVGAADDAAIGWIEAFSTSPRQKHLSPGVHAAGFLRGERREALTTDETGGESKTSGRLHEQEGNVTAGSTAAGERFGEGLEARLVTLAVGDSLVGRQIQPLQQGVALDDLARLPDRCHPLQQRQAWVRRRLRQIGLQNRAVLGNLVKGIGNSVVIHKKVEWNAVVMLDDQIAFDQQSVSSFNERSHGKTIPLNITVPAQLRRRANGERGGFDAQIMALPRTQTQGMAGLIQSVSQVPWPGLSAWVEVGEIAPFPCPKSRFPQPIST